MMPVPAKDPIAGVRLWLLLPLLLGVSITLSLISSLTSELEKPVRIIVLHATIIVWWLSTVARATRNAGFRPSTPSVGAPLKQAAKVALAGMLVMVLWLLLKHWFTLPKVGLVNGPTLVAEEPSVLTFASTLLTTALLTPVTEEMLFRASLFRKWRLRLGPTPAVLLTSVMFALLHVSAPTSGLFAIAMTVLYTTTGTVWAPIAAHVMNNLFFVTLAHSTRLLPLSVLQALGDPRLHIAVLLPALLGTAWLVRFLHRGWHTLGAPVDGVKEEDSASTAPSEADCAAGLLDGNGALRAQSQSSS